MDAGGTKYDAAQKNKRERPSRRRAIWQVIEHNTGTKLELRLSITRLVWTRPNSGPVVVSDWLIQDM